MKINYLLTLLVLIFLVIPTAIPAAPAADVIAIEYDIGATNTLPTPFVAELNASYAMADEVGGYLMETTGEAEIYTDGVVLITRSKPPEVSSNLRIQQTHTFNTAVYRHRLQYSRTC